jgi:KDO2-lipid IV(A) lauroyltransferase
MGTVGFYIFYVVNRIMTLLPLGLLYIFADLLFVFLYYFPGYRKKVVTENLRNSFPEKSTEEIALIRRKFYRHLADIFIETLKLTHLSNKELIKRFTFSNPGLLDRLYDSGRDLIVIHSHYNNWEWLGLCLPLYTKYMCIHIYKPLRNKLFDRYLNNLRIKNHAVLAPMNLVVRKIIENRTKNIRAYYGLIADQTPAKAEIRYYTSFLNQETPVFLGIEKIALKYDMSVVFMNVQKVRRGFYNLTIELLFEQTTGLPEYKVTETHVKRLEELIREKPEYWIWTHRRWKYKKPVVND